MDRWDVVILLVAGYLAVISLVRLMARRRVEMAARLREQVAEHREKNPVKRQSVQEDDRGVA